MRAYLVLVVVTAVACGALTPLMRRLGLRAHVFTPLRQRDVHRHPVPKLGGVAMAAAVLVGFAVGGVVPFLQGIYADDAATRALIWAARDSWLGRVVKYKFFPIGSKDAPRFPVFLGERMEGDL